MNEFITTYTKKHIQPLSPKAEDIDIKDISHALSLMVRANGHFSEFYSVCQHCVHCCEEALYRDFDKKTALMCLLHDASEAYIADIIRPVKEHIPDYFKIEKCIQDVVYSKFIGYIPNKNEYEPVVNIDNCLLYHEFLHFTGEKIYEEEPIMFSKPEFKFVPFFEAEKKFMTLFKLLS